MSQGLYNLDEFKDNCGFGLVAHIHGEASHRLLQQAIQALTCMTHRGALAADGKTGDGCGLMLQKPDRFFRQLIKEQEGIELAEQYAVGSIMLSQCDSDSAKARKIFEESMAREALPMVA